MLANNVVKSTYMCHSHWLNVMKNVFTRKAHSNDQYKMHDDIIIGDV